MLDKNKDEFDKMNITYWHNKGYTGKGVNIVVLDVNGKPFDEDKIIEPLRYIDDEKGYDSGLGHKTMVCTILREMLPNANIYAFRWSGGYKEEIIKWIDEHQHIIDVINCSFEGIVGADDFAKLKDFDIAVMGAMGNSSKPYANDTSSFDFVTGIIAWVESLDTIASYSNYGEGSDFSAYSHIKYISPNSGKTVDFGGTSCASPVSASLIGLYAEHFRSVYNRPMTRQETFEFQLKYVDDKEDIGWDAISGYGLVKLPNYIPELKPVVIEPPIIVEPKEPIQEDDIMADFKDINEHWAKEAIEFMVDKGLMNGYPDGSFQPNKPLSRAEYAFMKAKELGFVPKK